MREPHDIFMREFFEHPGWEEVMHQMQVLARDMKERLLTCPLDQLTAQRHKVEGVYEAISHLASLIKNQGKG